MKVVYNKDHAKSVTRWINFFAFLWFIQFLFGCQDFVISGAVSKWFFTRNKSKLSMPMMRSFGHLIRYHLGSICFGSLIIAIIQFIRFICRLVEVSERQICSTSIFF